MSGPRYAIYFTPPEASALWRFGSAVIGYDAYTANPVPAEHRQAFATLIRPASVADPARYGFHATLRAPFELRTGSTAAAVVEAAHAFASVHSRVPLGELHVAGMGAFIALVPQEDDEPINNFTARIVEHFEPFRAPLAASDRTRRLKARLDARQIELLDTWGYPYVFEQFRFHMSLTGKLEANERESILPALRAAYAELDGPVTLDAISVLEQPRRDGPFKVIARIPLRTS